MSELEDDHAVVEHAASANCTLPLAAVAPKFRPETVTDPPAPELASLNPPFADATGAATEASCTYSQAQGRPMCLHDHAYTVMTTTTTRTTHQRHPITTDSSKGPRQHASHHQTRIVSKPLTAPIRSWYARMSRQQSRDCQRTSSSWCCSSSMCCMPWRQATCSQCSLCSRSAVLLSSLSETRSPPHSSVAHRSPQVLQPKASSPVCVGL